MNQVASTMTGWKEKGATRLSRRSIADYLLALVDGGLGGIIFVAPYVFGGRHDMGRLVLLTLIAVTSTAWFFRQSLRPTSSWPHTWAHALILLTIAVLAVQVIPLPEAMISRLSPRTAELLPLWMSPGTDLAGLGTWLTLSLNPHETIKSLAMLVGYSLLFLVVAERIQVRADIDRLLRWIGMAAVFMAMFGILLFFTTDGRYFWFFQHPHRSASQSLAGAFINHNHFSHFLILGVGPLVAWLIGVLRQRTTEQASKPRRANYRSSLQLFLLSSSLVVVLFAVLLSLSRGGILTLLVAMIVVCALFAYRGLVNSKNSWIVVAMASVVFGLLSFYGSDQVSKRLDSLTQGSIDSIDRNAGRRKIWSANVSAISAGGLLGSGAGSHRMIYPLYLPETLPYEYSHAENGYLQVATENGAAGAILLLFALCLVGAWLVRCFRQASTDADQLCFGAIAGGAAASIAHSFIDFVWYIPACMSITIVLVACLFRLSQLTSNSNKSTIEVARGRRMELGAAATLLGGWAVYVFVGPAIASTYWNNYVLASVSNTELKEQQWSELSTINDDSSIPELRSLNKTMINQLVQVIKWDPHFGRAHLRLAAKYIAEFELRQLSGPNRMTFPQIRDAAISSAFKSPMELHAWLRRAFGSDVELLYHAQSEARRAVSLCPLQGDGYLYLAELCFLDCETNELADAYVQQGVRVRPYDAGVLFEVGKHQLATGRATEAIKHWQRCFKDPGQHQMKIVHLLAGRVPASMFLSTFNPDWRTLWQIWLRYRESGHPSDIEAILAYCESATKKVAQKRLDILAGVLLRQSKMNADVGRVSQALICLERAYAASPRDYDVRHSLAHAMADTGRIAEAETHFRWCLARRPADKSLSAALVELSKKRFAMNESRAGVSERAPWQNHGTVDSSSRLPMHLPTRQP